jgi:hypothetical protein
LPPQGGANIIDKNKCCYCGKAGHWARDYCKKKRDEVVKAAAMPTVAANLIQAEDDDGPGLMMACVEEVQKCTTAVVTVAPLAVAMSSDAATRTGSHVFLNE